MEKHPNQYNFNSPSALSSPSSDCSMNTDGNIHLYGSTMNSPMSGNMSPLSSGDSSSAYNFQHLQISSASNAEYLINSMNTRMDEPFLEITEQPIDKFRFRYKSEMHGTHGMLTGQHSKKTYPSVRLRNFNGDALIRCSLHQIVKSNQEIPFPHSHSLVVRCGNDDKKDPHEMMVSQIQDYKATFQGMGIIHTARRFIEDELFEKLLTKAEFESGGELTKEHHDILRSKAKKHSSDMNLNQVSLCFEAYERSNGKWIRICDPVFSTPINNLKSALTGELKISRMSTYVGSADGNDDLFMFVEKVGKKNIKVRFFELDKDEQIWEDWGKFTEADVHHQYAIALKTPPYRKINIEGHVKVWIQLYRPSDLAISEPIAFRYKPADDINSNRKRPRVSSFYDSDVPAMVAESAYIHNLPDSYVPQSHDMVDDTDIERMFPDLFNTNESEFSALNSEDFSSLLRTLNENNEFDKLAKDSVSNDDENTQSISREVKWIVQFLEKIAPLLKCNKIDSERFELCHKFCKYILDKANFNGDTMIHIGVKNDDLQLMERLCEILNKFQLQQFLNARNFNKESGVHVACALNKSHILQELIKCGADINALDIDGNAPIHVAIQDDNDECTSILLSTYFTYTTNEIHIDLSILNDSGYTPLHIASMNNNLKAIQMLDVYATKTKQSIFDDVDGKHGNNALHIAIESEAYKVAKYLIQNKCINPNKTNKSGHTALYLARVARVADLVILMQRNTLIDYGRLMDDDDDASSKDSFESQDTNKTSTSCASTKSITDANKPSDKRYADKKFDDACYTELSNILNKNGKWKYVANVLGYQDYVDKWQQLRNPTKVLLMYTESLKESKETLIGIFEELNEKRAVECIHEWTNRV